MLKHVFALNREERVQLMTSARAPGVLKEKYGII
jgi:hypothetical protein